MTISSPAPKFKVKFSLDPFCSGIKILEADSLANPENKAKQSLKNEYLTANISWSLPFYSKFNKILSFTAELSLVI